MDKPMRFTSLADLLADYVAAYACWWHTMLRVRIGLPVPHDAMYEGMVSACRQQLHICRMILYMLFTSCSAVVQKADVLTAQQRNVHVQLAVLKALVGHLLRCDHDLHSSHDPAHWHKIDMDHARCDMLLTGVLATMLLESSWKRMVNSKSKGQSSCVRS